MAALRGTIIVAGANGGLGTALVRNIVSNPGLVDYYGVYTVRDVAAATSPVSSAVNVRNAATAINAKISAGEMPRIRALILNAGYREPQGQIRTESGLDIAFASNYLGHWLLVLLLLQSMDMESGRVIILGGWTHDPLDKANDSSGAFEGREWKEILADANLTTIESVAKDVWSASPDDPSKDPKGLSGIRRYGASKLCSIMMLFELQSRLSSDPKLGGISVVGVDPGIMPTKITIGALGWFIQALLLIITHITSRISPNGMMRLPSKSAGDVLAAALQTGPPYAERPKGLYFNGSERKEVSIEAKDTEKRASVWKASVEYSGLKEEESRLADWA